MLVDSDVIIWHLRGNAHARQVIEGAGVFSLSAVTVMEILQGIRSHEEMRSWKQFLKMYDVRILTIDAEITSKAIFWLEEFVPKHPLRLADALIAATVDAYGLELLTGNVTDYKFLPGIKIKAFKPNA